MNYRKTITLLITLTLCSVLLPSMAVAKDFKYEWNSRSGKPIIPSAKKTVRQAGPIEVIVKRRRPVEIIIAQGEEVVFTLEGRNLDKIESIKIKNGNGFIGSGKIEASVENRTPVSIDVKLKATESAAPGNGYRLKLLASKTPVIAGTDVTGFLVITPKPNKLTD
ncbi:MAG: hypothetical protein V3T30_06640 [Thermodesulfobacteriota bacterium]